MRCLTRSYAIDTAHQHIKIMNKIRLCIFDFDGTLGDTTNAIIRTFRATLRELSLPSKTDDEIRATIGLPLERGFATLLQNDGAIINECAAVYRRIFSSLGTNDGVTLYPNVKTTLEALHQQGIITSIASSRHHSSLAYYVHRLGLEPFTSYILATDDVSHPKPHSELVEKTLSHFNIVPEECLVVGDAPYDIQMGKNAGCHTCAVVYGNGTQEELKAAGADHIISDFSEILSLLLNFRI